MSGENNHSDQCNNFENGDSAYMNFNQFMNQYNLGNSNYPVQHQEYYTNCAQVFVPQDNFPRSESTVPAYFQVENSTLVPTAAEFIPSWQDHGPTSATHDSGYVDNGVPPPAMENLNINDTNTENRNKNSTHFSGAISKKPQSRGNFRYTGRRENGSGSTSESRNYNRQDVEFSDNNSKNYDNKSKWKSHDDRSKYDRNSYEYSNKSRQSDNSNRNNYDRQYNEGQHSGRFDRSNYNQSDRNGHLKRDNRNSSWKSENDQHQRRNHKIEIKEKLDDNVSQRDKLSHEIDAGKLECLVCCERIKPFQQTWSCLNCFHIFHLGCTTKWANSSKSDDGWRCPACQNITKKIPREYLCFCGKTKNPQFNRNDLAHSCGELCERKFGCEHPCTQLCHPGPCPSCQATVTRYCGCGRSSRIMQCSQKDVIKCSEICAKTLNCGIHSCPDICHFDDCHACEEKVDQKCFCGKEKREVFCDLTSLQNLKYSCDKVCDRLLSCGNHHCTEICHENDCNECKTSQNLITSCPCGKQAIVPGQRKSCTDPIPLCNNICKKPLKCGPPNAPHLCSSRCHKGDCNPCSKETAVKCRCGHMDQMIKCRELSTRADDARCKKRCTKKRNCAKHKCNQECCIDIDHICPLTCTYSLTCGKHKCDQPCHKGRCLPCYRSSFEELYCECGANVIYPPVPCGTKRPKCDKPCSRSHPCDHPVQHSCHSAQNCPPCMIQTTKYCYGKHEQRKTIPCSQDDFSCGMPCNKPLICGRHKCIKTCHTGICENAGEICKQNCTKNRVTCGHKCNAPCHENDCPIDTPCKEMVEVTCQCGHRKQNRSCHDFSRDYRRIATASLASSMQEMQRGHSIELSDILGPVKNTKTLECSDDCRLLERNRRLAIGLQIRNPDVSAKLQPKYSDFLKGWAKKDPHFIQNIHDKLTELVMLSRDSKQRSRSHSFPTMNREKRQVIHEMCEMFGVESVAYDAEPNRNVVATAHKDKVNKISIIHLNLNIN